MVWGIVNLGVRRAAAEWGLVAIASGANCLARKNGSMRLGVQRTGSTQCAAAERGFISIARDFGNHSRNQRRSFRMGEQFWPPGAGCYHWRQQAAIMRRPIQPD